MQTSAAPKNFILPPNHREKIDMRLSALPKQFSNPFVKLHAFV
jgi:hypothetical protein